MKDKRQPSTKRCCQRKTIQATTNQMTIQEATYDIDEKTKRAALQLGADLSDEVVRQVRASAMGQTLREYEHTLRAIGVDYESN
jgi:HEAT repeat protein